MQHQKRKTNVTKKKILFATTKQCYCNRACRNINHHCVPQIQRRRRRAQNQRRGEEEEESDP